MTKEASEIAIVRNGLVNLYAHPKQQSELQGQYLLGEVFGLLGEEGSYYKVQSDDGLTGWVHKGSLVTVRLEEVDDDVAASRKMICVSPFTILVDKETDDSQPVVMVFLGTVIEIDEPITNYYLKTREWLRVRLPDGELSFLRKKDFMVYSNYYEKYHNKPETAIKTALSLLGVPYLWGGTSPAGLDCSGMTQLAMRMSGKFLPRNSSRQAEVGDKNVFDELELIERGDLLFFAESVKVNHVGLSLGGAKFIHASLSYGKVTITSLDKKDREYDGFFRDIFKFTSRLNWSPEPTV